MQQTNNGNTNLPQTQTLNGWLNPSTKTDTNNTNTDTNNTNTNPWLPTNQQFHQHSLAQLIRVQKRRMAQLPISPSNAFNNNNNNNNNRNQITSLPGPAGKNNHQQQLLDEQDTIFNRKPWQSLSALINDKYTNPQTSCTAVTQLLSLHKLALYTEEEYRPRALQLMAIVTKLNISHYGNVATATLQDNSGSIDAEIHRDAIHKYSIRNGSAIHFRDVAIYIDDKAPSRKHRTRRFANVTTLNIGSIFHEEE
jgi:hypothetical protein